MVKRGAPAAGQAIASGHAQRPGPPARRRQQLVDLVAETYSWSGTWPVWQYVAQQAYVQHGIDAEAAMRNLPRWRWPQWTSAYQGVRTVPAVAGNSAPETEARTVLTIHGLYHASKGTTHPWTRAFLKAVDIAAARQNSVTLSPDKARPVTLASEGPDSGHQLPGTD
jgi:hypothetical protein